MPSTNFSIADSVCTKTLYNYVDKGLLQISNGIFLLKPFFYDFTTVTFIDSYGDYMLAELYTTKSLSNIPRGIKIGDSVETLLSKFPSNGNYDNTKNAYSEIKDYINEDEKIIYYSLNESSMGTIKHDASGNVKTIEYSLNFDTSEANSTMTFEIVNNKIYSISVYRPVC